MITREPIAASELATRQGRSSVIYTDDTTGDQYTWEDGKFRPLDGRINYRNGVTITGAATLTAAQLATGQINYTGGAASVTLPTATLLGVELRASQGTVFDFAVDNTAGSGTCTIVAAANLIAGPAVITGGATLTVANSATQGIGLFRIVFSSATAAVLFRLG